MPQVAHHTRKVMRVGDSLCVVIPPHVLELMNAELGSFIVFDTTAPPFAVISVAHAPPYATDPAKYNTPPTMP